MTAEPSAEAVPGGMVERAAPSVPVHGDGAARRGTTLIRALRVENDRLGRLLGTIDGGRWWTTDSPDRLEIDALIEQAAAIRAAIDFIEREVGHLGGR